MLIVKTLAWLVWIGSFVFGFGLFVRVSESLQRHYNTFDDRLVRNTRHNFQSLAWTMFVLWFASVVIAALTFRN